jgi:uncharacterized membrane protein HdeD (DUF308 family)
VSFDKRLKMRILLGILISAVGASAMAVSFSIRSDYAKGFYMGTGVALLAVSIIKIVQNIRMLGNEDRKRAARIKEEDERNRLIWYRSSYYALYAIYLAGYVSTFYFAFTNRTVALTICIVLVAMALIQQMFQLILKYNT